MHILVGHESAFLSDQVFNHPNYFVGDALTGLGFTPQLMSVYSLTRMPRPVTITDDQILEAARDIFLDEGFNASTATIARRAGVSEGTIFKRFENKETLFFAALQIPAAPAWFDELDRLEGQGELPANLVTISLAIIGFLKEIIPRVMVVWGSRAGHSDPFRGMPEPPQIRDRKRFARFLENEVRLGRLRPCNTEVVARFMLGILLNHVLEELLCGQKMSGESDLSFVEATVEVLWQGIAPVSPQVSARSRNSIRMNADGRPVRRS